MFRIHRGDCHCSGQRNDRQERRLSVVPVDESRLLLILLESPHKDEYEGGVANPVGPARGKTGVNLRDKLGQLLGSSPIAGEVRCGDRIAVANPVQFQASLHAVHGQGLQSYVFGKLRDRVWESIWNVREVREDFETRVRRLAPTWIINACTGGSNGWGDVNGAVSEWLMEAELGSSLYATTHPAYWGRCPPVLSRLAKVNLNDASAFKMRTVLAGVGDTISQRLADNRPYQTLEEVERVKGIGPGFFEKNAHRMCLGLAAAQRSNGTLEGL